MNGDNHKFIATIIKGSQVIHNINKKVVFELNGKIYIKKIKEKNKIRRKKYVESESVNIICNDLHKDYVIIDSDNVGYYNKYLLSFCVVGSFFSILVTILISAKMETFFIGGLCGFILFNLIIILYAFYVFLMQPKKIYKRYTAVAEGEIIDYRRTEESHDPGNMVHCSYNIMYKYKDVNNNIIHSTVNRYSAELLYKDYPINKKVMIRYNPLKSCESCLADEYDSVFKKTRFVNHSVIWNMAIAKVTNIVTKCIDEEVKDNLREYFLSDFIECEYTVFKTTYKTYSLFGVYHDMFKIGDEIIIYYNYNDKSEYFCATKTKYGTLDKI